MPLGRPKSKLKIKKKRKVRPAFDTTGFNALEMLTNPRFGPLLKKKKKKKKK